MKKLTVLFIAALFVFGAAANSMAALNDSMILSVYGFKNADGVNQNGVSSGKVYGDFTADYNFGDIKDDNWMFTPGVAYDTGIRLADLTCSGVDEWGDIQAAIYGAPENRVTDYFTYNGEADLSTVRDAGMSGFDSATSGVASNDDFPSAGNAAVYSNDDPGSYVSQFNTGVIGRMQGLFPLGEEKGEANLGGLDNGDSVLINFYKAQIESDSWGFTYNFTEVNPLSPIQFSLDESDGSLVVNQVPVPAPLLLLGSGLLGLIGFRRKKA